MPLYLHAVVHFNGEMAGLVASSFDVGGVIGGVMLGVTLGKTGSRTWLLTVLVGLGVPGILAMGWIGAETGFLCFVVVPILGVVISSPTNLIASLVPSHLAHQFERSNTKRVLGSITGLIVGAGTVWAGLGMFLIGWLQGVSWTWVFTFLAGNGALAVLLLSIETVKQHRQTAKNTKNFDLELEES